MRMLVNILLSLTFLVSTAIGQTAADRLEAWEKGVESRSRQANSSFEGRITGRGRPRAGYGNIELDIKRALLSLPKSKFDPTNYGDFRKLSRSGLVRLFDSNRLRAQPTNRFFINEIPGDGISYSIRKKEYSDRLFSDFTLDSNKLIFGGALNQSLVADLGDSPPVSIDLNHPAVRDILTFQPSTIMETILKDEAEIEKGLKVGGYIWTRSVTASLNTTYLARVVAYDSSFEKEKSSARAAKFSALRGDERRDFVFVFRVVAIEEDGGVTVIWRELIRNKSPKLAL